MEGHKRRLRGIVFWDLDSDEDSSTDEGLGIDLDPDSDVDSSTDEELGIDLDPDMTGSDGSFNESTSNSGKPPNSTHSTASLDSFDTAEIQCLPTELREFTNWAFGPHGLPTLEVLAFGDFLMTAGSTSATSSSADTLRRLDTQEMTPRNRSMIN